MVKTQAKTQVKWKVELETGTVIPFALSIDAAAKLLSISRPGVYKLLQCDPAFAECAFLIGERTLISSEKLHDWVLAKCSAGGEAS